MERNFEIRELYIKRVGGGGLHSVCEGVTHTKILDELSIVQAIHGSYEIGLNGSALQSTGEGGVFVAPSNVVQKIVHHHGSSGIMRAHWVFLTVEMNGERLDELLDFPMILPKKYSEKVKDHISVIRTSENYFERMRAAYSLAEILVAQGKRKTSSHSVRAKIERYVNEHYAEDIKAQDIARGAYCSATQLFRYTKQFFGLSPANYVNSVRLKQAEIFLRNQGKTVTQIAFLVGFSDSAYFSKLFKRHYGYSPLEYRRRFTVKG